MFNKNILTTKVGIRLIVACLSLLNLNLFALEKSSFDKTYTTSLIFSREIYLFEVKIFKKSVVSTCIKLIVYM